MQPEENRVVMDTNIVVSAAISLDGAPANIFELFLGKRILNYTSPKIIEEAEEVLSRPFFKERISDEYRKFILESFKLYSVVINPAFNEHGVVGDEDDDKFINCALTANADIISGDAKLQKLKSYKGIRIFSARDYLGELGNKVMGK